MLSHDNLVTPLSQSELKKFGALLSHKGREESGLFLAEGVKVLEEAVRHGVVPKQLLYSPEALSERADKVIATFESKRVPVRAISAKNLQKISDAETPQGIVGIFQFPVVTTIDQLLTKFMRILWCDGIADPGNLGTLLRSALAFDFGGIIVTGTTADQFSPKVVRSSAGALFGLSIVRTTNGSALKGISATGANLIATLASGERGWEEKLEKLKGARVVAVGSEANGLAKEIVDSSGLIARIEHEQNVESLNAAVAGSIVMSRIYEQK